jgi:hypothetical protein
VPPVWLLKRFRELVETAGLLPIKNVIINLICLTDGAESGRSPSEPTISRGGITAVSDGPDDSGQHHPDAHREIEL